ncbi:MAG: hypothetical protein C4321_04530 [Chloroflexota bacterium]
MTTFRLLMSVCLVSASGIVSAAPRLTGADATKVAADFCQRIGAPVTAPAEVIPPDQNSSELKHWQSRWRVKFGDQALVEVVDASGIVS